MVLGVRMVIPPVFSSEANDTFPPEPVVRHPSLSISSHEMRDSSRIGPRNLPRTTIFLASLEIPYPVEVFDGTQSISSSTGAWQLRCATERGPLILHLTSILLACWISTCHSGCK